METKTYVATPEEIQKLYSTYKQYLVKNNHQYMKYCFKTPDKMIFIYTTNKVVEQYEVSNFHDNEFVDHAGSDESGAGEYFGPLTVCSCIVEKHHLDEINQLGIKDSKQLSNIQINQIAPQLMKILDYSLLILNNEMYNQKHEMYNLNQLKALLHNQAYINLNKKSKLPKLKIVDQFCAEKKYYQYLENTEIVEVTMYTKAENKFLAVACASIIARYAYMIEMEKLGSKYNITFPIGSGKKTDDIGKIFVEKYGNNELKYVAKLHFKNTERIKQTTFVNKSFDKVK